MVIGGDMRFSGVATSTRRLLTQRHAHWWWSVLSLSMLAGVVVAASAQGYTLRWSAAPTRSSALSERAVTWLPGALRRGNLIYVTRGDRQIAAFRVYSATRDGRPTGSGRAVYGYTRLGPTRLVICKGTFEPRAQHCLGRIVVAARLDQRPRGGLTDGGVPAIVNAHSRRLRR